MKTRHTVALSMFAGVAVGALAVQGLHAQAKPAAYVVTEIEVTNQDGFMKEFAPLASKVLTAGGGKYLARGGKTAAIQGEPPKPRVVLWAFDNMEQAQAAYATPAYADAKKIGDQYAKIRIFAVEGMPVP